MSSSDHGTAAQHADFEKGEKIVKLKPLTVIGLNSGTSMDGVDAAIFKITPLKDFESVETGERPALTIESLAEDLYEFEPALRKKLKALVACTQATLDDICRLNAALGEEFAGAALKLMRSCSSDIQVDLIGSHGQTIWHAPAKKLYGSVSCNGSLQLGEIAIIAERTGIPVIGDFRVQDMAAGGQGAPLVAFADEIIFAGRGEATGILNIGGIANLTAIDRNGAAIMAFDTGPGNMLADRCCERLFNRDYDEGGRLAISGTLDRNWLNTLLTLPYFDLLPPKTSGRELFGQSYADALIDHGCKSKLPPESILATITALTPASIAQQYERFVRSKVPINKIVMGGGGAENKFMLAGLREYWPDKLEILRHEDYGISTKFKEALLFALLAYTSYFGIPNNVPACTGAARRLCLGKICRP
jgi:anhydro-N-acetylmuramic acid kinase